MILLVVLGICVDLSQVLNYQSVEKFNRGRREVGEGGGRGGVEVWREEVKVGVGGEASDGSSSRGPPWSRIWSVDSATLRSLDKMVLASSGVHV